MNVLKKGGLYGTVISGRINFGRYIGRDGGYLAFEGSPYSEDHGELTGGVHEQMAERLPFVLISSHNTDWPSSRFAILALSDGLPD